VISGITAGYVLFVPTRPPQETFLLLRPGSTARKIAQELKANGIIRSERAFLAVHAWRLASLKAGEYRFERAANVLEVYDRVARGDIVVHTVTIPEGYNIFEVATLMEQAGLGARGDFLAAVRDTTMIADLDPQATSLEGYLFPDTYEFTRTQTPRDMVQQMVRRFRQTAQQLGLTADVHRIVTMASIVEEETPVADERPVVAGVYYNRLARNAALAADPTVVYGSLLIGKFDGVIRKSDLALDSPYNTYKYAGLPPGPIANPGRASLAAAMKPAKTDYLYFVADPANPGRHRFAITAAEHGRNVGAYRKAARP